jgi:hypothetical protein
MSFAPAPPRRFGDHVTLWRVGLVLGGFALTVAVTAALMVSRGFDAGRQLTPVAPAADAGMVIAGIGTQTTDSFYLPGGSYHSIWSAWGEAPDDPPCTHSVELLAVDPTNATSASGHVIDLAKLVSVPATGASEESDAISVNPGDYYLNIRSACAWQIALSPD